MKLDDTVHWIGEDGRLHTYPIPSGEMYEFLERAKREAIHVTGVASVAKLPQRA